MKRAGRALDTLLDRTFNIAAGCTFCGDKSPRAERPVCLGV